MIAQHLPVVMRAGYQQNDTVDSAVTGLGLGLALNCLQIVQACLGIDADRARPREEHVPCAHVAVLSHEHLGRPSEGLVNLGPQPRDESQLSGVSNGRPDREGSEVETQAQRGTVAREVIECSADSLTELDPADLRLAGSGDGRNVRLADPGGKTRAAQLISQPLPQPRRIPSAHRLDSIDRWHAPQGRFARPVRAYPR